MNKKHKIINSYHITDKHLTSQTLSEENQLTSSISKEISPAFADCVIHVHLFKPVVPKLSGSWPLKIKQYILVTLYDYK